ncbi:5095_t:CDS:2, partial [Funneliformis geosporum]
MKNELINWSEIIPKEIVELKSEISTLKSQLYQARKDVQDKGKYISSLEEHIPDFLAQLRLDLQNQGIDPAGAGANGRSQTIGHLRGYMRGRTLEWFDEKITTKANWELTNLTDGTGQANLVAVNGRTAVQIGADRLNEALGQPRNAIVKLRA